MSDSWPRWRILVHRAARRVCPYVVVRRDELIRLRRSTRRYQRLRQCIRRDGRPKAALTEEQAAAQAIDLTRQRGVPYNIYSCGVCGKLHVGYQRPGGLP